MKTAIIITFIFLLGFAVLYLKIKNDSDKAEEWLTDLNCLIYRFRNCPMSEGAFKQFCKEFTLPNDKKERDTERLDVAYREFNKKYKEYFE